MASPDNFLRTVSARSPDQYLINSFLVSHSDKDFFEPILTSKHFVFGSAESNGDLKLNLSILIDALFEFYKHKLGIDLNHKGQQLLFVDIDKLLQTESSFTLGSCEAMMQLIMYVFAILLTHESVKEQFIEAIMQLDEELQESLQGVVENSVGLMEALQATSEVDASQDEINCNDQYQDKYMI